MSGLKHIEAAFANAIAEGRAALMPYFTLGYPTQQVSLEVIQTLAASGADLIELGVPFSDPLADGPTIQHSTQVALEQGMTAKRCFEMVRQVRAHGVKQPLLLMGYINPILAYGAEKYVSDAGLAGADGLIIPDLPLEEAQEIEAACLKEGLALVYLAAPTSTSSRLAALAEHTSGFLYLVSLNGVTGARQSLAEGLGEFVARARSVARTPLAVGFGISSPEQAAQVAKLADGVIIGSAIINAAGKTENPAKAVKAFLDEIRAGLGKEYSALVDGKI